MSLLLRIQLIVIIILVQLVQANAQIATQTYESAIENADRHFVQKDFLTAKTYYEIAIRLKKDDPYAGKRLGETLTLLKQQMETRERFYEKIDQANKFDREGKADEAIKAYKEALSIVPNDANIRNKVEQLEKQLHEEKEKLNRFARFIETGKALANEKKYEEAIFQFTEAAALYPNHAAIAENLPPLRTKLNEQLELEKQFNTFMSEYEKAIARKEYDKAIASLRSALALFPEEPDALIKLDLATQLKKKTTEFNESLAKADELYAAKDFRKATMFYEKALGLMPDQTYPADMLKRINEIVSDINFIDEKAYSEAIAIADEKFNRKVYSEAKDEYQYALRIKPEDAYASRQIAETEKQLEQQKNTEYTERQFREYTESANKAIAEQNWDKAVSALTSALELKPADIGVSNKLRQAEIELSMKRANFETEQNFASLITSADKSISDEEYELALSYLEKALALKPSDLQTSKKVEFVRTKLEEQIKQQTEQGVFAEMIEASRKEVLAENWTNALKFVNEALKLKPADLNALDMKSNIENRLEQLKRNETVKKQYMTLITEADNLVEADDDEARKKYEEALKLLPDEEYPKLQITKIEQQKTLAETLKNKEEKLTLLSANFKMFLSKDEINPSDSIARLMTSIDPNHPITVSANAELKTKRTEIELRNNQRYNDAIALADKIFESRDYREAIVAYKTARSFKPQDTYASDRIVQAENIIREQLTRQKTEYDKTIAEADKLFITKAYDKAVEQFSKAATIKPDESYPAEMISKITGIIEVNKLFELNLEPKILATNADHRYEFDPVPVNERKTNYILIKAKNTGTQAFSLIVSYGSRNGRNGGFVLPIPASAEYKDYIVRIGSQYKWFSEDNTWINFYPENGSVEVGLIQISRGN